MTRLTLRSIRRQGRASLWLWLSSLWITVAANGPFFDALSIIYGEGLAATLSLLPVGVLLFALISIEMTLFALLLPLSVTSFVFLSVSALIQYYQIQYGTVFDATMIRNIVETDANEAGDLITWGLISHWLIWAFLPWGLIRWATASAEQRYDWRARILGGALPLLLLILTVLPLSQHFATFFRVHRDTHPLTNPVYPVYSFLKFLKKSSGSAEPSFHEVSSFASTPLVSHGADLVVLVVGETARADHFSLNGYHRVTNPRLSARLNLVSYQEMIACGTSTAVSLPCMFSYLTQEDFEVETARYQENVLDTLRKAGVEILWRDNNSGSKHVADRVPYEGRSEWSAEGEDCDLECRDIGMLRGLETILGESPVDRLIVLHQMGSHGPAYFKRYPKQFEQFTPACRDLDLSNCTDEEIINAYDNTILYTDHFLDQVVELLERFQDKYEVTMMYVGDHGESLGESGLYLHGMPYAFAPEAQTRVPFLVWGAGQTDLDVDGSRLLADKPHSHDELPNALLSLFEVESDAYIDVPPLIAVKP